MATLQKIRNRSGLLVVVIGVALLAFIVGDLLTSGSIFFGRDNNVAEVNGEEITAEELQVKFSQAGENLTDESRNQIFDQMVMSKAIIDCAENIGIAVGDDELSEVILGNNPTPSVAQFAARFGGYQPGALAEYANYIFSVDQSNMTDDQKRQIAYLQEEWKNFEETVRVEKMQMKMMSLLAATTMPNDVELEASYNDNAKLLDIAYISQPYNTLPDSVVSVSRQEMDNLYSKLRESFKTKPYRVVEYVTVSVLPSPEDYKASEDMFTELSEKFKTSENAQNLQYVKYSDEYESIARMTDTRKKEFVAGAKENAVSAPFFEQNKYGMYRLISKTMMPDSVELRAIMLGANQEPLCDSIYNVLKTGGDFAAMAKEYSVEKSLNETGGSFGWLTNEYITKYMDPEIAAVVFNGQKGVQKVKTQYGLYLIEVTNQTKLAEYAKVAKLEVEVLPSQETRTAQYNKIRGYIADKGAANFGAGDVTKGISVQKALLTKGSIGLNNVPNTRQVVHWAYNTDVNNVSEIYNIDNNLYVAAKVVRECTDEYFAFEEVEPFLKDQLIREKKAAKIAEVFKGFDSLEAAAEALGATINTVESVAFKNSMYAQSNADPKLVGQAQSAKVGELQKPVAGINEVYLYQVTNVTNPESAYNKEKEMSSVMQESYRIIMSGANKLIEEISEIEDNRTILY